MGLHISPLDELPAEICERRERFPVLNCRKQGNRRTFCTLLVGGPAPNPL